MEGMEKNKNKAIFFVIVIVIFSICTLGYMNYNYDTLARYPYKDERSRTLIKEYLNKEEIDYIIEYSIAPNVFISFIEEDGFNIYHASEYKELSNHLWYESTARIVEMVENTREYMDVNTLIFYLDSYRYEDIEAYFAHGDIYSENASLVLPTTIDDVYLDEAYTISTYQPDNLQSLNEEDFPVSKEILVTDKTKTALSSMCSAMEEELGENNGCAGLIITEGYISYDKQKVLYEEAQEQYGEKAAYYVSKPGHDEHQLGKAIDFKVEGISDEDFSKTIQSLWLSENAYRYGFVETYCENDEELINHHAESYHYRYIGEANAIALHDEGISFAEYKKGMTN